jgi:FAD/FMN-containing dehydrogenase
MTRELGEPPRELHAALERLLGPDGVRGREAIALLDPGMNPKNLGATLMVRPRSDEETAHALALCARAGVAVVPQGGRTGLAGGAESRPGEVIVSLDRMDRIERLEPLARTAVVQAGVTLAGLEAAAAAQGLSAGIDLGARDSATVGGMVATNGGGIDGNVHFTINADRPIVERYAEVAALVYEGLREIGGSFSAEHGIGLEKRSSLEAWAGPTRHALMRAVKRVFDPAGIMNPGKMLAR